MKVVTSQEMRSIDSMTIQEIGIPGIVLMENAGVSVVKSIEDNFRGIKNISIFVGKGNNGGDGLVCARHLFNRGYNVKAYLLSPADRFSGDALTNLTIAQNMSIPMSFILSEDDLVQQKMEIAESDLIIDAIFGTGLTGEVRGFISSVIEFLNSSKVPIVSVDLPSGLDADSGKVLGQCVKAEMTVTMGLPKRGLLLYPGANYVGKLLVADIGIPEKVIGSHEIKVNISEASEMIKLLPSRPRDSHKGTFGKVLIIGGSVGLTGAAAMASLSALRVGAGLVTLGIPSSLNDLMEVKLTEVMTMPLPETRSRTFSKNALEVVMNVKKDFDVIAIGPGASREPETALFIQELCKSIDIPKVIDADALNALAEKKELLGELGPQTVLTPHPGEMSRLTGIPVTDIQSDRIGVAQKFAMEHNLILVLKGVPTVIADPSGVIYLNITGNPGLSSGGTGDVLTGMISGLIAQGLSVKEASILGVYLHGLSADLVARNKGEAGIIAGDIIENIPIAINHLKSSMMTSPQKDGWIR